MTDGNYIVAVDIGTSRVTMMVAQQTTSSTLSVVAEEKVEIENNGVQAGKIQNANSLQEALKTAKHNVEKDINVGISSAYVGIAGSYVRCVIVEEAVRVADISTHCVTTDDVRNLEEKVGAIIVDSSEEVIDRIKLYYTVDDGAELENPVGAFGKVLKGKYIFAIADSAQILRLKQVFRMTGINITGFVANPTVGYKAILTDDDRAEGVLVVDMGCGTTDLAVVSGGHIEYFASIPIGGATVDADIHAGLSIPSSSIVSLRRKYGCALASKVDPEAVFEFGGANRSRKSCLRWNLATIIECRLREILSMVKDEVKEARLSSRITHGIVLTGGMSRTEGIEELATSIFGIEAHTGSLENGFDENSTEYYNNSSASCFGILLHGAEKGYCSVTRITVPGPEQPTQPVGETGSVTTEPDTSKEGNTTTKEPETVAKPKPTDRNRGRGETKIAFGRKISDFFKNVAGILDGNQENEL